MNLHIDPQHRHEWQLSQVNEKIIDLNLKSLSREEAWEHLFYDPQVPRINSGRLEAWILKQWTNLDDGGWWCNGLDPLDDWRPQTWGRLKPNTTRIDWSKGKDCKYESPFKAPARLTYFRVPLATWEMVATRYNVAMPNQIVETGDVEAIGFWAWVLANPQIPIILTEGEKKAACLLSFGFAAIALPGIWMGTRKAGGIHRLHPDLKPMAQPERKFIVLFDYEVKPKTQKQIRQATCSLGKAIEAVGCVVEVATLPGPEKGIDDWAAALGKRAAKSVAGVIADAASLMDYRQSKFENRCRGLCKYKPAQVVNSKYLAGAVQMAISGLIVLLSGMATGKTTLMEQWRSANGNIRFLNGGHRITLLRNLAGRLETAMYSEVKAGDLQMANALSITADSLYKLASDLQAYGCVFIDEACQYLSHLLLSKTCKEHQAEILDLLQAVIYNAPLVVIADAHMDDVTIDFFKAMRPEGEEPHIIQNEWKEPGRETYWYPGKDPSPVVAKLCATVWAGEKAFLVSDSKRTVKKIEHLLNNRNENFENIEAGEERRELKIWAIHAENAGSEENQQRIANIKYAIKEFDVVLASPVLGTGVDLSEYHFDAIFGIFNGGTLTATECLQILWRYRPNVPMHIWVSPYPPFGYRPVNPTKIKEQILSTNRMTAHLIRIDKKTGERGAENEWSFEAHCQLQAQRNFSLNNLRADVLSLLQEMRCPITTVEAESNAQAQEGMKVASQAIDRQHCEAVARTKLIDKHTYNALKNKEYLKPEEALQCQKYRIWESYGFEVTAELVKLDDEGRLTGQLIALEETLALPSGELLPDEVGRIYPAPPTLVFQKDEADRQHLPLCFHWRNRSATWLARHNLGLRNILLKLFQGEQFTARSPEVVELQRITLIAAAHIKQILGTTIPPDSQPMWILSQFVQQLGLKLKSHKIGAKGEQVRHYYLNPESQAFAVSVLAYRQDRREEKERMHQEAKEQNEAYAAQMAAQYGTGSQKELQPVSTPPTKHALGELQGGLDTVALVSSSTQRAIVNEAHIEGGAKLLGDAAKLGTEEVAALLGCWQEEMRHSVFKFIQERSESIYRHLERLLFDTPEGWRFFFG